MADFMRHGTAKSPSRWYFLDYQLKEEWFELKTLRVVFEDVESLLLEVELMA